VRHNDLNVVEEQIDGEKWHLILLIMTNNIYMLDLDIYICCFITGKIAATFHQQDEKEITLSHNDSDNNDINLPNNYHIRKENVKGIQINNQEKIKTMENNHICNNTDINVEET